MGVADVNAVDAYRRDLRDGTAPRRRGGAADGESARGDDRGEGRNEKRWAANHHPFTSPTPDSEPLLDTDPGAAIAQAYDLVVNGTELGSGSIRIHRPALQAKIFDILRISAEEQRSRFGFLLDALSMGAPPHGGFAPGMDRTIMLLAGEPNLRDVIAFPKNQAGVDPMTGAPSDVTQEQLDELGIRVVAEPN